MTRKVLDSLDNTLAQQTETVTLSTPVLLFVFEDLQAKLLALFAPKKKGFGSAAASAVGAAGELVELGLSRVTPLQGMCFVVFMCACL